MDRLTRSVVDLAQLVQEITSRGIRVEFVAERLVFDPGTDDPFATFQLHLLGAVAQLERSLIRERQRDGIEIAKAPGVYRVRARKLTPEQVTDAWRTGSRPGSPRRRSRGNSAVPVVCSMASYRLEAHTHRRRPSAPWR